MKRSVIDIIGQLFWFGIFVTPLIAFLIVRKSSSSRATKIAEGLAITLALAFVFFLIAYAIFFSNGMGPG